MLFLGDTNKIHNILRRIILKMNDFYIIDLKVRKLKFRVGRYLNKCIIFSYLWLADLEEYLNSQNMPDRRLSMYEVNFRVMGNDSFWDT